MTELSYPRRIELARVPTPLVALPRTSEVLGVELLVKRDDLTGVELSGNKVRKLEFLLAEALAEGADTVITGGGEQSNHCRATALAATRVGLKSIVLLRTADPHDPPSAQGNILLDRLAGAEIVWITPQQWQRRSEMFERTAEAVRKAGGKPYIIPEGGSNAVGAWGYVRAAEELARDLAPLPPATRTTLITACGSGGTSAGLVLGTRLLGLERHGVQVASINVCDDEAYFVNAISAICADFDARFATEANIGPDDLHIVDGYVGKGYAQSQPAELAEIAAFARREAILLDPVYSGKAFYALTRELAADATRFGDRIVFVHTGGIFGLFSSAAEIADAL